MKKILSLIMATVAVIAMQTVASAKTAEPQIKVDGRSITFRGEQPPVIQNDRLYVPVRRVLEEMDSTVNWDGETKSVTVNSFDNIIVLKMSIDNPVITRYEYTSVLNADKTEITSDVAPVIINSRTMLPIRVIAEALGATVYFEDDTKTTYITTKQAKRVLDKMEVDYSAEEFMIADAYKENVPKLYIECDTEDAKADDIVKIKVKVDGLDKLENVKISSITAGLKYDKESFEYLGFSCVKNGEEAKPMMSADNGEFTENMLKVVTLDTPDNAYLPAEDGTIMIIEMRAIGEDGGAFALSDGVSDIGNDTELLVVKSETEYETLSGYEELYIDTAAVTVK